MGFTDIHIMLNVIQTIDLELDTKKNCTNYPNENFKSYQDCDRQYFYDIMKNRYGLMPFWVTDDLNEVTNMSVYNGTSHYGNILDGTDESLCKIPCLKTKIFGAEISRTKVDRNFSKLDITIKQSVTVTEYFFPKFSVSLFLSSMGGALGLWLGLGVLQLATNIVNLASWIK